MSLKSVIEAYKADDKKVVQAFGVYHPYRSGNNPNFDSFSSDILKIKNLDPIAVKEVCLALDALYIVDIAIAVVPSHDPATRPSGIRTIAEFLCKDGKRGDATKCLVRHTKVNKAATGGSRQIQVHAGSIRVDNPELIKDKLILLLDDVTTTNNSLIACRDLLIKSGAKKVFPFALAQTALTL